MQGDGPDREQLLAPPEYVRPSVPEWVGEAELRAESRRREWRRARRARRVFSGVRGAHAETDIEYVGIGAMAATTEDEELAFRLLLGAQRVSVDGRAMLVVFLAEHAANIEKVSALDASGNAGAARLIGIVAAYDRDEPTATAAFRRADQRGDAIGAVACGALLRRRGLPNESEAAFERATERDSALGAALLCVTRWERGDHAAWREAWKRAARLGFDWDQFTSSRRVRLIRKIGRALLRAVESGERWIERHGGDPDRPEPS